MHFRFKIGKKYPARILLFIIILVYTQLSQAKIFDVRDLKENEKNNIKKLHIWNESCPVPLERLRVVHFAYFDFQDSEKLDGEIVVMDAVALRVLNIFKELHTIHFPIAKAKPIENYEGNDDASLADNNTSSFNCRAITGGGKPSIHSYGLAIDINPIQNPYLSLPEKGACSAMILPKSGQQYMNRTNLRPGMSETIIDVFKKNGFTEWGGNWNTLIDWQHFQLPRMITELLSIMHVDDAGEFFEIYAKAQPLSMQISEGKNTLVKQYRDDPKKFMETLRKDIKLLLIDY